MKRLVALCSCALLVLSLSGCLGTSIQAPPRAQAGPSYQTLRWHLLASPTVIRADSCPRGLADVTTYVPLWGLAIGIFTLGIVVPQRTILACVADA